jgi:hypothetical protein
MGALVQAQIKQHLQSMSVDELWRFRQGLIEVLIARIASERRGLETKLAKLNRVRRAEKRAPVSG